MSFNIQLYSSVFLFCIFIIIIIESKLMLYYFICTVVKKAVVSLNSFQRYTIIIKLMPCQVWNLKKHKLLSSIPLNSPTQYITLLLITCHKLFHFSFYILLSSSSKDCVFHDCTVCGCLCMTTGQWRNFSSVNPIDFCLFDSIVATWLFGL